LFRCLPIGSRSLFFYAFSNWFLEMKLSWGIFFYAYVPRPTPSMTIICRSDVGIIFTFFHTGKSNQSYAFYLKWHCCGHSFRVILTKFVRDDFFSSKIILHYNFFDLIIDNLFERGVYHQSESSLKLHVLSVYSTDSLILFYE